MRVDTLRAVTTERLAVVSLNASLRTAARSLAAPCKDLVLVCHEDGKLAGMISSRELARFLANSGTADQPVASLMRQCAVSCSPDDDVDAVWADMVARGLQEVPVLGTDRRPLGVLDISDATCVLLAQEERQAQMLVNYVMGIGYR